jgi:hypothetical protein
MERGCSKQIRDTVTLVGTDAVRITNSMASVRERTIPTERPPLVAEVGANFCG